MHTEPIAVKQYIIDKEGHKVAVIIDIDELSRIEELLEDISDLKAIEDRMLPPINI